jgi:hypothetical protein
LLNDLARVTCVEHVGCGFCVGGGIAWVIRTMLMGRGKSIIKIMEGGYAGGTVGWWVVCSVLLLDVV